MVGSRVSDGSAGDANYGAIGVGYREFRRPESEIEAVIHRALGDSDSVINVGAGAGSYEPRSRAVTAVEPSAAMREQRPRELPEAIVATAEELPFADGSFEAAMSTFSVHQWADLSAGLRELRRVATGPVIILTCDPDLLDRFWLNEYAPEALQVEARRYPDPKRIAELLGGNTTIVDVPIPLHCVDGFGEAYYGRPELLLDPDARRANSAWSFVDSAVHQRFEQDLRQDLESGEWDRKHGHLRTMSHFTGSLVLISSTPD